MIKVLFKDNQQTANMLLFFMYYENACWTIKKLIKLMCRRTNTCFDHVKK